MGPDKIPVVFVKTFVEYLIKPLYLIFEKSNITGVFPTIWKYSYVTPVPKKGDKGDVKNYRSIVKNSIFAKMFDALVESQLSCHLKRIITCRQHEFMSKRSTTSNLAIYSTYIADNLKTKCQVDSIYTDMRSAFDRVNHDILISKLQRVRVVGSALKWVKSFLKDRQLKVKIKNYESFEFEATSGVPQGSHCGPLLFIFMINDLINCIQHSELLLFADDFKLFKAIKSYEDRLLLQSDLDNVLKWANDNKFEFNVGKCAIISFYKFEFFKYSYFIDGNELPRVETIKDLGLFFDSTFTFEPHIQFVINKSLKKLGFIQRFSKHFSDPTVFLQLYKSLVNPQLTYASEIWSPANDGLSYSLEKVQNKFLRFYSYRIGKPMLQTEHDYTELLKISGLPTLASSRIYQDVLFVYKIINSLVDSVELLGSIN